MFSDPHEPMSDARPWQDAATARPPFFVGVDVGGTNIKIGLVDDEGRTLAYGKLKTGVEDGPEAAMRRIGAEVNKLFERAGVARQQCAALGVASPGPIDIPSGKVISPGNLPTWWDYPLRDRVAATTDLPATFANDANAAAYGEYWLGAGADFSSMVLLTLGTGIGGGIIVHDSLIDGAHSCGSECGHMLINPDPAAPQDSLGKSGSLEAYANANAVVTRAREALERGERSQLEEHLGGGSRLTPRIVAEAAEAGDALALRIVMETADYLALGVVTLIHVIDPDSVVLGGAMTFGGQGHPLGEKFLQRIRDGVRPRLLAPLRDTLRIDFASLGGDAGYIGAAGLARQEHQRNQPA